MDFIVVALMVLILVASLISASGKTIVFLARAVNAGIRSKTFAPWIPVVVAIIIALLASAMIDAAGERLIPTPGISYPRIEWIQKAADRMVEWVRSNIGNFPEQTTPNTGPNSRREQ